jgi:hypothetical protein
MATLAQYDKFFETYNPSAPEAEEWHMWCQAFVARCAKKFGTFERDYLTARAARLASGRLNPDHKTAPVGAIGYWLWPDDDDVAIHIGGGVWMRGSRHVTTRFGGVSRNAGYSTFDSFQASAKLPFLGWSLTNGGNIVRVEVPEVKLAAHERRVNASGVSNGRSGPGTNYPVVQELPAGETGEFDAVVKGEDPYDDERPRWIRGAFRGSWFWLGAFTEYSGYGLTDLGTWDFKTDAPAKAGAKPADTPVVLPDAAPKPYAFTKDLACVTEVIPAHYSNLDRSEGSFPTEQHTVVVHDFGTEGVNTVGSVLNYFQADHTNAPASQVSSHFVVSGTRIIQMVSLSDRAWHAGAPGNDFIGIECDPAWDAPTVESVRVLLVALRERYGVQLKTIKHSSLMATKCGDDVDLASIDITPDAEPAPAAKPAKPAVNKLTVWLSGAIAAIAAALITFLTDNPLPF